MMGSQCVICGAALDFAVPKAEGEVFAPLCLVCVRQRVVERGGLTLRISRPALGQLFQLGRIMVTREAVRTLTEAGEDAIGYLARHGSGDWGEGGCFERVRLALNGVACQRNAVEDTADLNARAVRRKAGRVMSIYRTSTGVPLWAITDFDSGGAATVLMAGNEN